MSDIEQQIREMANLTMLSNKLNPIQEKNLKMYPLVFFEGVSSVTIKFDLSNGRELEPVISDRPGDKFVEYHLAVNEGIENPQLELRCKHIEGAVRNLFWSDVLVFVYFNGKQVFASEKKHGQSIIKSS